MNPRVRICLKGGGGVRLSSVVRNETKFYCSERINLPKTYMAHKSVRDLTDSADAQFQGLSNNLDGQISPSVGCPSASDVAF